MHENEPAGGADLDPSLQPSEPVRQHTGLRMAATLVAHRRLLTIAPIVAGIAMYGAAWLMKPQFTSETTFLPPQQQQSPNAAALASLGALSSIAGANVGLRTPGDQYVSLLQSTRVTDQIIDRFRLMEVYHESLRVKARKMLRSRVAISYGKKDGLITVEVTDTDPKRAAEMANRYVDELRSLTATIALTEAQQRRQFFEKQLLSTKARLTDAQVQLQATGFNPGAMKSEPRTASDAYARLRAELTSAEVRLQTMRGSFADGSAEVMQQAGTVRALRDQLAQVEANAAPTPAQGASAPDYVTKYREYKYQETLFDLFARQFELAKADESREGQLIQVVDVAQVPELKSKPGRLNYALGGFALTFLLLSGWLLARDAIRAAMRDDPAFAAGIANLRNARRRQG